MVLGAGGGGREEVVEGAVLEETFLPGGISPPRAEPNRPPPQPPHPRSRGGAVGWGLPRGRG